MRHARPNLRVPNPRLAASAALLLALALAWAPPLPAAPSDPTGDVVAHEGVAAREAERLFAESEAAIWIPDEGRFLSLRPEAAPADPTGQLVARRVQASELGRRFRPGPGRAYLLKQPAVPRLPVAPDAATRTALAAAATPIAEGFEGGMGAWTISDNTLGLYDWGTTTCEARGGTRSADAHRGGANTLTCSSAYPAESITQMRHTGCESLSGASRSYLDFWVHMESEADYDGLGVYYEADDGKWYGYRFTGSWAAWFHLVLNLKQWYRVGDVTSRPCPRVLVEFSADESEQPGFGARIDDLTIGSESPLFLTCGIQASPTSGAAPLDVSFTPVVTGASAAAEFLWSFGDAAGSSSTSRNATFRFADAGDYLVRLRVVDSGVRAYAHQTIHVTTGGPTCSVSCAATVPATAVAGTAVPFAGTATATSCSGALSYAWTFGDGGSSAQASASHAYATAGTYSWTFTATASGQSCTRSGTVTVTSSPQTGPRLTVGSVTGPAGGTVTLPLAFAAGGAELTALAVDLSLGSALSYVSASGGAAATAAGKLVAAASTTGGLRLLLYGLNQTRLADGAVAGVVLAVRAGTPNVTVPVTVGAISGSDGSGRPVTLQSAPGSVTVSGSTGPATSLLVPVVLSVSGAGGSFYTSELTLTNRGSAEALLTLEYSASIGGGSGSATERLAAGRQLIVPDAVSWLRGKGIPLPSTGNRLGTLRVTSTATGVSATCRTATAVPEGRAGLAYPGVGSADLLTAASYLCGLRGSVSDRSNVAVVNAGGASDGDIRLRLTVRSGDPAAPGSGAYETDPLPPGGWLQLSLDDLLSRAGLSLAAPNVFVKVERTSGSAPYYAYGVVNDNGTSDGSFVFPVPERALDGKTSLTLPVVVETSAFTTEVSLTNFGTTARTLLLTYVASAVTASGNAATQTLTLQPGEQRLIPAFVDFLRALGTPGVPARGPTFAGALFASALSGDVAGVVLGGRTSSAGGAGRYGLFYTACPNGNAVDGAAWLFGLQQNGENRTNLALVNTGERGTTPVTLRVEIWNGDTGQLAATVEGSQTTLDARRFTQLDRVLSTYAPGATHGWARVTRVSGTNPFLTYAVVNDGAEPGQRSGDGAYVPMQKE